MTSLGLRFCSYLPSSPFAFLFDYFSIEGFVLFFLIGDPTVLYFCVNLILFLLTALFKIVVMLFMATERSLCWLTAVTCSGKFTSSQGADDCTYNGLLRRRQRSAAGSKKLGHARSRPNSRLLGVASD